MAEYDFIKIQKKLSKYLDENRFHHTLGVMYTCAALAMAHDCPIADAQLAGLLHDCAKCIPNKKKLKMCGENKIPVTEFENFSMQSLERLWQRINMGSGKKKFFLPLLFTQQESRI